MQIQDKYKPLLRGAIFIIFGVLLYNILLPFVALTWGHGAEQQALLDKVQIYSTYGIGFGYGLTFLALIMFIYLMFPKSYKYLGWMGALINNYEDGMLKEVKFFDFFKKLSWQIAIFLPFFLILGYLGITQTGIPFAGQQVSPVGKTIINIEPAGSEIFILAFLISLIYFPLKYLKIKNNWTVGTFWSIVTPSCLLTGTLYGYIIHTLRYSGSDADIFAVVIFWFTASLLILLTGGFILAWLFKDINNLFQNFKEMALANDTIFLIIIFLGVSIEVIVLLYLYISWQRTQRRSIING